MKTKTSHLTVVMQAKKYDLKTVQTEGKGVDRYLSYLEYKDGTPLTESEIEEIKHHSELHSYLIG